MSRVGVGAVIVAAGSSSRMRGTDKLWADLGGKPLLARTLSAFTRCPEVERIVVVIPPDTSSERILDLWRPVDLHRTFAVCSGGESRQESVFNGLVACPECELVVIHDGARPLVTPELITKGVNVARERGSALCAVRAKSTFKLVSPEGAVMGTPPRDSLWEAQTPQIFRYGDVLLAHARAMKRGEVYTDDAALMEAAGHKVWVYEGSYRNLKVTTPEDLLVARALLDTTHP